MLHGSGRQERAHVVALGAEGPQHDALAVIAEQTSAYPVQNDVDIIVENSNVRQSGRTEVGRFTLLPPEVADGRISVVCDQDIVSQAVQAADRVYLACVQGAFIKVCQRGIDETVLVHVHVFIFRRNKRRRSVPLFLGHEVFFPDVIKG